MTDNRSRRRPLKTVYNVARDVIGDIILFVVAFPLILVVATASVLVEEQL